MTLPDWEAPEFITVEEDIRCRRARVKLISELGTVRKQFDAGADDWQSMNTSAIEVTEHELIRSLLRAQRLQRDGSGELGDVTVFRGDDDVNTVTVYLDFETDDDPLFVYAELDAPIDETALAEFLAAPVTLH